MTWVMTLLPLVLLVLGFPIFVILLATSAVAIVMLLFDPADRAAAGDVRDARQLRAAGGAVLHLCRRDHGVRRHFPPPGGLDQVAARRHQGEPADHHGRDLRGVRGDLRLLGGDRGGGRAHHLQADGGCRLRPAVRHRPAHGLGADRQHDPARDRHDPLRGGGRAVAGAHFHRRLRAGLPVCAWHSWPTSW